jgi:hypothetical protein
MSSRKAFQRAAQEGDARGVPLDVLRRQAIEEEVERSRFLPGEGTDLARHIQKRTSWSGKPAGEAGG